MTARNDASGDPLARLAAVPVGEPVVLLHSCGEGPSDLFLDAVDILALDDALTQLAVLEPRLARNVELRYFGGLSVDDAALVMGIGTATVKRDWVLARAWLRRELGEDSER